MDLSNGGGRSDLRHPFTTDVPGILHQFLVCAPGALLDMKAMIDSLDPVQGEDVRLSLHLIQPCAISFMRRYMPGDGE
jgi:hypothetical protein